MFDKDFYPTPPDLVSELLTGIDLTHGLSILEPSAGKGDIANEIKRRYDNKGYYRCDYSLDLDCIELNSDLQNVLKGNGHRVVHDDFLSYNSRKKYDYIIMNPPFSNGAEHLLKAIEMIEEYGGEIRCILNAETLRNPYTYKRKLLVQQLEHYDADIQFVENGFKNAERKTDVDVAVIKIKIPYKEPQFSIVFDELQRKEAERQESEYKSEDLITNDFVRGIVQQYNFEIELGLKLIDECRYINSKILRTFDENSPSKNDSILSLTMNRYTSSHYGESATPNEYIKAVRNKYWQELFRNPQFTGMMTSNIKSEFQNGINELVNYDFSEFNIYTIKLEMLNNTVQSVDDTILKLFEEYSNKYHWFDECSNNVHYYNGWKTNKAYVVGKKVIVPYTLELRETYDFDNKTYTRKYYTKIDGSGVSKLIDTEKVFNYLDGGNTDFKPIQEVLEEAGAAGQTKKIECKYFFMTFYKKGTCHITFKDDRLLKKFNLFGSQRKGWLPPCYGKKVYEDMTAEEKAVIDEYEGKESYKETLSDMSYYIQDTKGLLMIESGVSE